MSKRAPLSEQRPLGRVEDYTNAFLASSGLLAFMLLFMLAAAFGWIVAIAVALLADRALLTVSEFKKRR
ncbi:hypothetical protein [Cognatishimia sp. MH4019]|uniref:hypothetical protein n=1 Tax=Cognatishimia sp. MH4019 TaxID=2854030 RepID=UPI001CD637BB|nr:hypothetical protein [Cognatishimia sp. MH4019]